MSGPESIPAGALYSSSGELSTVERSGARADGEIA
jgi:hypothetical protein